MVVYYINIHEIFDCLNCLLVNEFHALVMRLMIFYLLEDLHELIYDGCLISILLMLLYYVGYESFSLFLVLSKSMIIPITSIYFLLFIICYIL